MDLGERGGGEGGIGRSGGRENCARNAMCESNKFKKKTQLARCVPAMVVQNLCKWPTNVWLNLKPTPLEEARACTA